MNNEKCSHPQCGFFRDAAGTGCRAMLDNACAREAGNPASVGAPTASDAGTIEPIQRWEDEKTDYEDYEVMPDPNGTWVKYADHLQHVAAAVAEAEKRIQSLQRSLENRGGELQTQNFAIRTMAETIKRLESERAAAEADLAKLRSTAGVGELAARLPNGATVTNVYEAYEEGRKAERAATAPVSATLVPGAAQQMADSGLDVTYGGAKVAPVSAAEQARVSTTDYHRDYQAGIEMGKALAADEAAPADGRELPALDPQAEFEAWLAKDGEASMFEAFCGGMEVAMRQSQGASFDDAMEFAARTLELYDDATMLGDYMIDSNDAAAILRAMKGSAVASGIAAKQAGKEPS